MIEFVIFTLKLTDPHTPSLRQVKKIVLPGYVPPKLVRLHTYEQQQTMWNAFGVVVITLITCTIAESFSLHMAMCIINNYDGWPIVVLSPLH